MTISNELRSILKLVGKTEDALNIKEYTELLGYPRSFNQSTVKVVDTLTTKYSHFDIVAVMTHFYEFDGQEDSSYCEAKYTLYPEQTINGIKLTKVKRVGHRKSPTKSGQGKNWYYESSSDRLEWQLVNLV